MKRIDSSAIDQSTKTTSSLPEEECPMCGAASWCFQDGVIFCPEHKYFEPEPTDVRLYAMRQRLLQSRAVGGSDAAAAISITPDMHKVRVDVGEEGTRAAQVTAITGLERVDEGIQTTYEHGSRQGA